MWNYTDWLARSIIDGLYLDYYDLPVVVDEDDDLPVDPPVVVDVIAPLFGSASYVKINENLPTSSPVYDAQALDNGGEFDVGITYRLAPVYDNALFTISPEDGIVYFRQSPDYENPQAWCPGSNWYILLIEASDESGNTNDKLVHVQILDVDESTPPSPPVVVIPAGIPDFDDNFFGFL